MGKNYGRYKKGGIMRDYRIIKILNGFILKEGLAVNGGMYYGDVDSLIEGLKNKLTHKDEDEKVPF